MSASSTPSWGCSGIDLFGRPLAARLVRLPHTLAEAFAVTLGAQLATLPLTVYYFQVLPVLAPVANAVVLPTLPGAISAAIGLVLLHPLAAAVPPLGWLTAPLAAVCFWQATLVQVVAHAVSAVPGAAPTIWFGPPHVLAYYAALGVVTYGPRLRRGRVLWPAAAAVAALASLWLLSRPDGRVHVRFLARVAGPAVVVVAPDGAALAIDGGSSATALRPELDAALPPGRFLPGLGPRLDAVALTGLGVAESGAAGAFSTYRPSRYSCCRRTSTAGAADAAAAAGLNGARVERVGAGVTVAWHGLLLTSQETGIFGHLALEVRSPKGSVLVVEAGAPGRPATLPRGTFVVAALGDGAVEPFADGFSAGRVVLQPAPGRPLAHGLTQRYGSRLWRTDRDGELVLDP